MCFKDYNKSLTVGQVVKRLLGMQKFINLLSPQIRYIIKFNKIIEM